MRSSDSSSELCRQVRIQRRLLLGIAALGSILAAGAFLGFSADSKERLLRRRAFTVVDRNGESRGTFGLAAGLNGEPIVTMNRGSADRFVRILSDMISVEHEDHACRLWLENTFADLEMGNPETILKAYAARDASFQLGAQDPFMRLWLMDLPSGPQQMITLGRGRANTRFVVGDRGSEPQFKGSAATRPNS